MKGVLPSAALERIVFPSSTSPLLPTFFDAQHLQSAYGGDVHLSDDDLGAANPIFDLISQDNDDPFVNSSDEEDGPLTFYSAQSSRHSSRAVSRRPSWMHLTSAAAANGSQPPPLLTLAAEQAKIAPSSKRFEAAALSGTTTPVSRSESGFATPASGISSASSKRQRVPRPVRLLLASFLSMLNGSPCRH